MRRDEAKRKKKLTDEAAGVYTSFTPSGETISDPDRVERPTIPEDDVMSTPTTIGINVSIGEAKKALPHLTDALSD